MALPERVWLLVALGRVSPQRLPRLSSALGRQRTFLGGNQPLLGAVPGPGPCLEQGCRMERAAPFEDCVCHLC